MSPLLPHLLNPENRPALTVGDTTLTYQELLSACGAHVGALQRAGIEPGDPVAVWTQPGLQTAVALVGNALYGAVSVPLNAGIGQRELEHIMADAAPRLVLAATPEAVPAAAAAASNATPSPIVVDGAAAHIAPRPVDDSPLLLLYTSGTTGPPKGALITGSNIAANLDSLADAWCWTEADTVVHALPLFHVHGLVLGLFGSLRRGGRLHWIPKFAPASLAEALTDGQTVLFAVPTMIHRLAEAAERDAAVAAGLRAARALISGSAPLPLREHRRIEQVAAQPVRERYGLTETLINCAVRCDGPAQPGCVGPALRGVQLRLVDDQRRPLDVCDDATLGEVAVRGPHVFAGYHNRPEATAAVRDEDGWFYTGDLATRTPEGALRIVGRRATDLIKTGGFKVGAGEVEGCLLEHPGVREVAVVGVPDDDLGERITAFVVPTQPSQPPRAEELVDRVAADLAAHKRPRTVVFVESLPKNAMGKVLKPALRQLAAHQPERS